MNLRLYVNNNTGIYKIKNGYSLSFNQSLAKKFDFIN